MQNIWLLVDLLAQNPHLWLAIISSSYGVNLDSRMLDVGDKKWYASVTILTICFYHPSYIWVNDRLLPLLLTPNRISKLMDLRMNCPTSALINSAGIWSIPGDLCLFSFSTAISNSTALGSGTGSFAVCISVCLISLNPWTFNTWEKWSLHLARIPWEIIFISLLV